MKTFIVQSYDKGTSQMSTQEIQAENLQDAKDEIETSLVQIVSIREKGWKARIATMPVYVPTRRLEASFRAKQDSNWKTEIAMESAMLGENQ